MCIIEQTQYKWNVDLNYADKNELRELKRSSLKKEKCLKNLFLEETDAFCAFCITW